MITAAWIALAAIILTVEAYTLAVDRGTLSSHVKWLRARLWGELIVVPLWAWLTYHWFVDVGYSPAWDVLVVAGGVVLVVVTQLGHERSRS